MSKLVPLSLLFVIVMAGCAHKATVPIPDNTNDPNEWRLYYEDQFKAHGGEVEDPGPSASMAQRAAYEEERSSWQRKKTTSIIVGAVSLGCSLVLLLATLSQL